MGGGLIRDSQGNWVKGYMRNIGVATSVTVGCWALRDGLLLASQLGIAQLVVELDARVVVGLFVSNNSSNKHYSPLLNDCRSLLTRFLQIRVNHVYWEENRCADKLAKEGCSVEVDFVVLDRPSSSDLCNILYSDAVGM